MFIQSNPSACPGEKAVVFQKTMNRFCIIDKGGYETVTDVARAIRMHIATNGENSTFLFRSFNIKTKENRKPKETIVSEIFVEFSEVPKFTSVEPQKIIKNHFTQADLSPGIELLHPTNFLSDQQPHSSSDLEDAKPSRQIRQFLVHIFETVRSSLEDIASNFFIS